MTTGSSIYRFVFAGGGTGGHLYPALAVAEKIRELKPESEILFIGAKNKIEEKIVPQNGFKFKPIWISGFSRKMNFNNILFPLKVIVAYIQSLFINIMFKPRVAIGSGAYVSGPVISTASTLGAKIVLLEQNSYPGITNRLLEKKAHEIHLAFEDSKKYFREKDKIKVTGNPVRPNLKIIDKREALSFFGLNENKKTLFVTGGSGGAKSINRAVAAVVNKLVAENIQLLWQTGKNYFEQYEKYESDSVKVMQFIDDISKAYSAADLVLARAGATTIAEVSLLGVPVIFVPSPNVAANHQFKNAESLQTDNAAELIKDSSLEERLFDKIKSLINNQEKLNELKNNIKKFSKPDAARVIAEDAIKLAEKI